MPNNDGGACAGAWASTSLPRLRFLVCETALDAPYAITSLALHAMVALLPLLHAVDATLSRTSARHGTPPCRVSPKGNGSGIAGAARKNFNTGSAPRNWLDFSAAGRADARRHAGISRRGDVPREAAARSN